MRSKVTHQRGPVALRKVSGQIVGEAILADCLAPITASAYPLAQDRHRIPLNNQPWASLTVILFLGC